MKEWTTPDFRNTLSTTNLEEEEIVDALGKDGNVSMPELVNRPNPWRKMMMMMMMMMICVCVCVKMYFNNCASIGVNYKKTMRKFQVVNPVV